VLESYLAQYREDRMIAGIRHDLDRGGQLNALNIFFLALRTTSTTTSGCEVCVASTTSRRTAATTSTTAASE